MNQLDLNGVSSKKLVERQTKDLQILKDILIDFISEREKEDIYNIFNKTKSILVNCDKADYSDVCTIYAYAFIHLIDRYHRFQMMILDLFKKGYLHRIKNKTLDIIDVGTGPAPALYAFFDYYEWLYDYLDIALNINLDYVEASHAFRSFLHHFTEYALQKGKEYRVPFHRGSFEEFKLFHLQDYFRDFWGRLRIRRYRYDVAIMSNFLTNEDILEGHRTQIQDLLRSMRNNGLLIIVGASLTNDNYNKIYKKIDRYIKGHFNDKKYAGYWKKVRAKIFNSNISDSSQSTIVSEYYSDLINLLKKYESWNNLDGATRNVLERASRNKVVDKWYMVVYQKHSWRKYKP